MADTRPKVAIARRSELRSTGKHCSDTPASLDGNHTHPREDNSRVALEDLVAATVRLEPSPLQTQF